MTFEELHKQAAEIIKSAGYIVLATASSDAQPWNSPLSHEYDLDLSFYFVSAQDSIHASNIAKNRQVFIVLFDSTAPEGSGTGVYIKAESHAVTAKDDASKITSYKAGIKQNTDFTQYLGDRPTRQLYKIIPQNFWINDIETSKGSYVKDIRLELEKEKLIKYLKRFSD